MDVFSFLNGNLEAYKTGKKDINKDVKYLASLIRANKLMWFDELTGVQMLLDKEQDKQDALDRIGSFACNIKKITNPVHCYDAEVGEKFFYQWWNTEPDSDFLFLYRIQLPEKTKGLPRKNDYNTCCLVAIEEFKRDNGYAPTRESVIERLRHKPPEDYAVDFDEDNKTISIDGNDSRSISYLKKTIATLLERQ